MTWVAAVRRSPLLPLGLGAVLAFGQEPYGLPLVMIAALVAIVWLFADQEHPRAAFKYGWLVGAGYFLHALQWIVSPFFVDVGRHGWMAPFALVFLAGGIALFWAFGFGLARAVSRQNAWGLIVALPAVEILRAYLFTGFPWAMLSQALVDTALGQMLALIGPYALNLCLVVIAVVLGSRGGTGPLARAGQAVVGLAVLVVLVLPPQAPTAELTGQTIRLVQPNAAQRDKWNPDLVGMFFDRQLAFTAASPAPGARQPDLVVWSETAIPWLLNTADRALLAISTAASDTPVALGVQRFEAGEYYNSVVALAENGEVFARYDKHHLVPFGEYMPFKNWAEALGLTGLAAQLGSGYAAGDGAGLLDLGAVGKGMPLICYEAVFPHDVNAAPERPDFLIHMSNDAWFGKGAGPKQHLAQARMRAIEQGLPLARAANTGISAMIDPQGRILAKLELNTAGFLDAPLPRAIAPTLYSKTGDKPFILIIFAALLVASFRRFRV